MFGSCHRNPPQTNRFIDAGAVGGGGGGGGGGGVGVGVGVGVGEAEGDAEGDVDGELVGEAAVPGLAVGLAVDAGVGVGVGVGEAAWPDVADWLGVGVVAGVCVGVAVTAGVDVGVGVAAGVEDGAGVGSAAAAIRGIITKAQAEPSTNAAAIRTAAGMPGRSRRAGDSIVGSNIGTPRAGVDGPMVRVRRPDGDRVKGTSRYTGVTTTKPMTVTLDHVGKRVFVAGASGAVGRRLVPLLLRAGHEVTGTTRSEEAAERLADLGVTPVVLDARDGAAVTSAIDAARPEVVIHQLTDLAGSTADNYPQERLASTALLRSEVTPILVRAAVAVGATRFIAQSSAMLYAPGPEPHTEDDPLVAPGTSVVLPGIVELERGVQATPTVEAVLLRYGLLYGPGTPTEAPDGRVNVHIDAAAWAASLAVDHGPPGTYNIVDDGPVANARARELLGWSPDFRLRG